MENKSKTKSHLEEGLRLVLYGLWRPIEKAKKRDKNAKSRIQVGRETCDSKHMPYFRILFGNKQQWKWFLLFKLKRIKREEF